MKDGRLDGIEARRTATPQLPLDAVKSPPLPTRPVPIAAPKTPNMDKSQWNTKKLGLRLGADALSAASAAVLVAPIISIIDRLDSPHAPQLPRS